MSQICLNTVNSDLLHFSNCIRYKRTIGKKLQKIDFMVALCKLFLKRTLKSKKVTHDGTAFPLSAHN